MVDDLWMTYKYQIQQVELFLQRRQFIMGCTCSEASDQSQSHHKTQQQHINNMLRYCSRKRSSSNIVQIQIWVNALKESIKKYYWTTNDLSDLIEIIEDYILVRDKFSQTNAEMKPTIVLIQEQFRASSLHLRDKVQRRNKAFPAALVFYQSIKDIVLEIDVDKQKQQLRSLSDKISSLASEFEEGYLFFSLMLVKSCLKLKQKNMGLHEINERLDNILRFLNKDLIDTPQAEIEEDTMLLYQNLMSQQYNKIESKKYVSQDKVYKKVKLQHQHEIKSQKILYDEIIILSQEAKDQQEAFKQLIYDQCKNGKNLKISLKLKNVHDKLALSRIEEKIILKINKPYTKEENLKFSTVQELRLFQKQSKRQQFKKILDETQQFLLYISDMLRGRCIFKTIHQINDAALGIIKKVNNLKKSNFDIEIVEVDNRLKALTNDIVLKIRIRKVVCELQLALATDKYQSFKNQIYHKVYEIGRSKTLTSLSMLFDWHQKLAQKFVKFAYNAVNSNKIHLTYGQQKIYYLLMENLQINDQLLQQYKLPIEPFVEQSLVSQLIAEKQNAQNVGHDSMEVTKSGSADTRQKHTDVKQPRNMRVQEAN